MPEDVLKDLNDGGDPEVQNNIMDKLGQIKFD